MAEQNGRQLKNEDDHANVQKYRSIYNHFGF